MKRTILAVAAIAAFGAVAPVQADGISDVEGARAHERQGTYLTRQEREKLRRYGGNDDGYTSGDYGYYGYGSAPPVQVYVEPGYGYGYGYSGPRRHYRSYGY